MQPDITLSSLHVSCYRVNFYFSLDLFDSYTASFLYIVLPLPEVSRRKDSPTHVTTTIRHKTLSLHRMCFLLAAHSLFRGEMQFLEAPEFFSFILSEKQIKH